MKPPSADKPYQPTALFSQQGIRPTVTLPWRTERPSPSTQPSGGGGLSLRARVERMRSNAGNTSKPTAPMIPPATTDEVAEATMPGTAEKITPLSQHAPVPIRGQPSAFERVKGFREDSRAGQAFESVGNVLDQVKRVPGGIAQGAVKTVAGIGTSILDRSKETAGWMGDISEIITGQESAIHEASAAAQERATGTVLDATNKADRAVQIWTDTRVAAPESAAAEKVANVADIVGEELPGVLASIAVGALPLVGSAPSYGMGFFKAYGQERMSGGSAEEALLRAGVDTGVEMLSGGLTAKVPGFLQPPIEGLEEIASGGIHALVTGKEYTIEDAMSDFGYGTAAGVVLGGASPAINAINTAVVEGRVGKAVNERIGEVAKADVSDVQSLLERGSSESSSPVERVLAADALRALQRQTNNPTNVVQRTTNIPADIAAQFNLKPVEEARRGEGKGIEVETISYEGRVSPQIAEISGPEVSTETRAEAAVRSAESQGIAATNPRAMYEYGDGIFLRPDANTNLSDSMMTYRGQANQFFRTSQNAGSIPASGPGTSWEGSGVYSALDTYSSDMYGPSGKLADNPYNNLGIERTAIRSDTPVGTVLEQSRALQETVSPLTRKDAPEDVVQAGERRIRMDDQGRGFITEVVNNPVDVRAIGLNFGRETMETATPIQYADIVGEQSTQQTQTTAQDTFEPSEGLARRVEERSVRLEENPITEYTVENLVSSEALTATAGGEQRDKQAVLEQIAEDMASTESAPVSPEAPASDISQEVQVAKEMPPSLTEMPGENVSHNPELGNPVTPEEPSLGTPSELPDEISRERESVPSGPEESRPSGIEEAPQRELNLDKSERIWAATEFEQKRRKGAPGISPDITKGEGSLGQIYATRGYNTTFGMRSAK